MRTRKDDRVQFRYNPADWRRQARLEIQRKERKRERKLLVEQAIIGVVGFIVLTIASGVLA